MLGGSSSRNEETASLIRAPFSALLTCDAGDDDFVCAADAPRAIKAHGTPGKGLYATRKSPLSSSRDPTERVLAYLGGVLRRERDIMRVLPEKLRNTILSDAICLDLPPSTGGPDRGRLCVSPRDMRTGKRFPIPDAARAGVLVNEPADRVPFGYRAVDVKGTVRKGAAAGPFAPNATLGEASSDRDILYSFVGRDGRDRKRGFVAQEMTSADGDLTPYVRRALRDDKMVYYPIMQTAPLLPGEEITACYDYSAGPDDAGGYQRVGYARPRRCVTSRPSE
jgi:hypothetical protein